jgi:hypothetical protein
MRSPTVTNSATGLVDSVFIDISRFKQTLRKGLGGLSYIGMIEPALYINIDLARTGQASAQCRGMCMQSVGPRIGRRDLLVSTNKGSTGRSCQVNVALTKRKFRPSF